MRPPWSASRGEAMPESHSKTTGKTFWQRHRVLRVVLLAMLAVVVVSGTALAVAVHQRLEERRLGLGVVSEPTAPVALDGSEERHGSFSAQVAFTCMAARDGQEASTEISWDDDWFFQDPTAYNHDLATTCAVLSAIANSESAYYQAGSSSPAYMEEAITKLGFQDISTASYQYRSEVFDEIVDLLTGTEDVVAYSLATKRLVSSEGDGKTLYLVSIRGSYGSEWVSDLNMGDVEALDADFIDHEGFMRAASEVVEDLEERLGEDAGKDVTLLFTGHSRGAATANLAATYADDRALSLRPLATHDDIYCYTFATPEVTTFGDVDDPLYDNIFNILNPSDLVPRLPLATWGFSRYGHDLWLPGYGDEGFDGSYERTSAAFEEIVGNECPYVPSDRERFDAFVERLGNSVPTAGDLATVGGVISLVGEVAGDINPVQVLYGHYPSVYIAWMQAIDGDALVEGAERS